MKERRLLWALAAVTLVALILRFATIGTQSIWYDELVTQRLLQLPFKAMLTGVISGEGSPPLYYLLAWPWTHALGFSPAALRSLSAVFGTATVPVVYAAGATLFSRRAGLVAAALVAVNPMLVWYSQEGRNYALLGLLAALSFLFFARALTDTTPRSVALWALASSLAIATHYSAAWVVVPEAVWLFATRRELRGYVAIAAAQIGAVGLALASMVAAQADNAKWISQLGLGPRVRQVATQLLVGPSPPGPAYAVAAIGLAAA
jgi:mannosyltransferase